MAKFTNAQDALLYGRLYLPTSTLEGLYLRRLTPLTHFRLTCVSSSRLPNGGSMLALLHHATPRHSTEYMYSTDSALLGIRSLYNFGPLPLPQTPSPHGRFSAGFELYYGLLNKSSGTSLGLRFATLPAHTGFPYTMTLTLNPLMGNLSSTYSVRASERLALSSRFDFNVYSYESELRVGLELWRRRRRQQRELSKPLMSDAEASEGESLQRSEGVLHSTAAAAITIPTDEGAKPEGIGSSNNDDDDTAGVLKARIDQRGNIGVVWEGRVKELLYACGVVVGRGKGIGSGRGEGDWTGGGGGLVSGLGLEISYSS